MNEVEKLFQDLPGQEQFQQGNPEANNSVESQQPNVVEDTEEESAYARKNRRQRRLEEQLQREKESNIALNERIKTLAEQQKFLEQTSVGEPDERFLRIYGDSPETRQAWKLQQELLADYAQKAKEEALMEFEQRAIQAEQEQKSYENLIDDQLEAIEDEYNVDVTSDSPAARKARREFLEMVQQFSPKDENGNITDYADFNAIWNVYQAQREKPKSTDRQKEISARSMKTGGTSASEPESQVTPGFRGWMKDYGLN